MKRRPTAAATAATMATTAATATTMAAAIAATMALVLGAAAAGCGSDDSPGGRGKAAGHAVGHGVIAAMTRAQSLAEPYRCARMPPATAGDPKATGGRVVELGGYRWRDDRTALHGDAAGAAPAVIRIGVIADARGDAPGTLAAIAALRDALAKAGADIVISAGGMGGDEAALTAVLGALADGAPWPVIALPGDRESLPAHRAAIAAVAARGGMVVDGAVVRRIEIGGEVAIATLPGVDRAAQLIAGADGCAHDRADADAALASLSARGGAGVLVTYAAPRQRGTGASDVASGGIHAGEIALAEALEAAASPPDLVLHGSIVAEPATDGSAPRRRGDEAVRPVILGAGAAEHVRASDVPTALLVVIEAQHLRWQRLTTDDGQSHR